MNYKEDYIKLLREHRDLATEYTRVLKEKRKKLDCPWITTQCHEDQTFTNANYFYHAYYTGEPAIQGNDNGYKDH